MNKKSLLLAAVSLIVASAAFAKGGAAKSYSSAGCGFGAVLFEGKEGKAQLILAATTNGSFGSQTFGISSETLGCTSEGVVKNDKQLEVYASVNFQKLSTEMARGGGEYLTGLSKLMGCKDEAQKQAFFKLAQTRYEKIVPSTETDSTAMLRNLKSEMAGDPVLRTL